MDFQDILYEKKDHIARITINRPERHNAFDMRTAGELAEAFEDAGRDISIGVVVLTGAGDKAFCAGGFLGELKKMTRQSAREFFGNAYRLMMLIRQIPKPVIAAVNGYAMGGGNELVIAADLAIASERAKFGQTGPRIGSSPVLGGTNTLMLSIGDKKTREVVYLCRPHDAYEAERRGWINKVVPHEELYPEVDRWCQEILDKSPQYIEISKISCNALSDMLYPAFHHAMEMLNLMAGSEQMIEGATAFLEKRKPDFRKFRPKTEPRME